MTAEFTNDVIIINAYDFKHSTMIKNPELHSSCIQEVNLNFHPPQIVINNNEIIFVDVVHRSALTEFSKNNNLKLRDRSDLWLLINESFSEAEGDFVAEKKTLELLLQNGIGEKEVDQIRMKIKHKMLAYKSILWNPVHLGHKSTLDAYNMQLSLSGEFYWWTMEIALRNYSVVNSVIEKS
jgi:hypothetical protein